MINYNHKKENLAECLGLTDKRHYQIIDAVKNALAAKSVDSFSKTIEHAEKALKPCKHADYVLIGMYTARILERARAERKEKAQGALDALEQLIATLRK